LIESAWELPLLNTFLPSFLHTIATCDREDKEVFHFAIYLAYDLLDEFYDRPVAIQSLRIAFDLVMQESRRLFGSKQTPSVELRLYRSHGTKGAPCWIWNSLASKAYVLFLHGFECEKSFNHQNIARSNTGTRTDLTFSINSMMTSSSQQVVGPQNSCRVFESPIDLSLVLQDHAMETMILS
jgi:hypothetical protein